MNRDNGIAANAPGWAKRELDRTPELPAYLRPAYPLDDDDDEDESGDIGCPLCGRSAKVHRAE